MVIIYNLWGGTVGVSDSKFDLASGGFMSEIRQLGMWFSLITHNPHSHAQPPAHAHTHMHAFIFVYVYICLTLHVYT